MLAILALLSADPSVVGYLPDYRLPRLDQIEVGLLSDVILFAAEPVDGRLPAMPPKLVAGREAISRRDDAADVRVHLCVGGWGKSDGFAAAAATEESRTAFVADCVRLVTEHDLDGIDFDWEHPEGRDQLRGFVAILADLKAALKPSGKRVSVALAPWKLLPDEGYDHVDAVHLMSYDHAFPQATLQKSRADFAAVVAAGCPREKLFLGVPFYGRSKDWQTKTYANLAPAEGDLKSGFAFNGPETVRAKADLVRRRGLGGLMIWEIGQDVTGEDSLLRAASAGLQGTARSTRDPN